MLIGRAWCLFGPVSGAIDRVRSRGESAGGAGLVGPWRWGLVVCVLLVGAGCSLLDDPGARARTLYEEDLAFDVPVEEEVVEEWSGGDGISVTLRFEEPVDLEDIRFPKGYEVRSRDPSGPNPRWIADITAPDEGDKVCEITVFRTDRPAGPTYDDRRLFLQVECGLY